MSEYELLKNICEELQKRGIKARLLNLNDPEAIGGRIEKIYAVYDPYEGISHLGSINIYDRNISQLQVFTRIVPGDISGFRWYDVHFVIRKDPKGKEKNLTADCKIGSSLFRRDVKWSGGTLAKQLNSDEELKKIIKSINCPHRIRPDNQYKCVRIVLPMGRDESKDIRKIPPKIAESFKAFEKIAKYINQY